MEAISLIPTFKLQRGEGCCDGCVFQKQVRLRGVDCATTNFFESRDTQNSCRGDDGTLVYIDDPLINEESEKALEARLTEINGKRKNGTATYYYLDGDV